MRRLIKYVMGWMETWRILRNKELMESIRKAQKDVEEGEKLSLKKPPENNKNAKQTS